MENGYIQVYTGKGKGKTTAALGLAIRAASNGLTVKFIQFLKGGETAEIKAIESIKEIEFYRASDLKKRFWNLSEGEKRQLKNQTHLLISQVQVWAQNGACDVLILDEVIAAINKDFIRQADIESLFNSRKETVEIVLTGRNAPDWLIEQADLVSDIVPIKHYYQNGILARPGIEY